MTGASIKPVRAVAAAWVPRSVMRRRPDRYHINRAVADFLASVRSFWVNTASVELAYQNSVLHWRLSLVRGLFPERFSQGFGGVVLIGLTLVATKALSTYRITSASAASSFPPGFVVPVAKLNVAPGVASAAPKSPVASEPLVVAHSKQDTVAPPVSEVVEKPAAIHATQRAAAAPIVQSAPRSPLTDPMAPIKAQLATSREACLKRLYATESFQEAKAKADRLEARVRSLRKSDPKRELAEASLEWIEAKSAVTEMTHDALLADPQVQQAERALRGLGAMR